MSDVQPDYTPYLNLVRPDLHDDVDATINKIRDAIDAIDAWAQAHAAPPSGGLAGQRHIDSSTPLDDGGVAVLAAPSDDLLLVDASGGASILVSLPDSAIGKTYVVARVDGDATGNAYVTTPQDSVWGFQTDPGGATTVGPHEAKTFVSNGADGWWFTSENHQNPPQFYGLDPNNIDWATLQDAEMLAFSGYTGKFYWTNLIPGITRGVHFSNGPVSETLPDGTRYVNALAQSGAVTITLPSPQHGYFPEFGGSGEGLLITIWKTDNSGNSVTIVPPDGNPFGGGDGISPDGLSVPLTQYGESVTVVAWNSSWWVLEHTRPGPRVVTRTDNDSPLASGDVCLCDTSIRSFHVNLPPEKINSRVTVKKISNDARLLHIDPGSGVLIEGAAGPYDLTTQGDSVTLICDGANWWAEAVERGTPSTLALDDLSDVQIGTLNDQDLLRFNGADAKWEDVSSADLGLAAAVSVFSVGSPTTFGDIDLSGLNPNFPTVYLVDATIRANVTLPPAANAFSTDGNQRTAVTTFKKLDASVNPVHIIPNGSETIDGAASLDITTQWGSRTLVTDGSNWFVT